MRMKMINYRADIKTIESNGEKGMMEGRKKVHSMKDVTK